MEEGSLDSESFTFSSVEPVKTTFLPAQLPANSTCKPSAKCYFCLPRIDIGIARLNRLSRRCTSVEWVGSYGGRKVPKAPSTNGVGEYQIHGKMTERHNLALQHRGLHLLGHTAACFRLVGGRDERSETRFWRIPDLNFTMSIRRQCNPHGICRFRTTNSSHIFCLVVR